MCLYFRKLSFKQLFYLTGILVLVDQGTKALVRGNLHVGSRIPLITDFLFITYVQNYRGFSWFVPDLPQWVIPIFFTLRVVIVFMAFPVYLFYTQTVRKSIAAVTAVLGISAGVIGNLLDDIFMPFTTDFLQVFHSPSANFADIFTYLGIMAICIETFWWLRFRKPIWRGFRHFLIERARVGKAFYDFLQRFWTGKHETP
jgi:signal peptidase II